MEKTDLPDKLLDTKTAAQILGIVPFTLRKWRMNGEGPSPIKLGRTVRYDPRDLKAFIDQGRGK